MALEVSAGMKHAHNENMLVCHGVKNDMGRIHEPVQTRQEIVSRYANSRKLREQFEATLQREMVFQCLSEGRKRRSRNR